MWEDRLFLDIGNSSIKAAFRKEAGWELLHPQGVHDAADLVEWIRNEAIGIKEIILASVRKDVSKAVMKTMKAYKFRELTISDVSSLNLDYKTPETLGIDRYLGCLGASTHASGGVVVIDAGSACTIDYMSEEGVYHGGVIMPGVDALFNIFRERAPELPEVPRELPASWPGKSTQEALQWGQLGLLVDGIHSAVERHRNEFGDFELYLTGGGARDLKDLITEEYLYRPHLVFDGMAELLKK